MSERGNVSRFATWVGGQIKAARGYADQKVAELSAAVDQRIAQAKSDLKAELIGGASSAYDTLGEIQAALQADATATEGILSSLAKRVRVDAVQTFTAPEQAQGRANIGAASAADLGADEVDYVAVAVAARDS